VRLHSTGHRFGFPRALLGDLEEGNRKSTLAGLSQETTERLAKRRTNLPTW